MVCRYWTQHVSLALSIYSRLPDDCLMIDLILFLLVPNRNSLQIQFSFYTGAWELSHNRIIQKSQIAYKMFNPSAELVHTSVAMVLQQYSPSSIWSMCKYSSNSSKLLAFHSWITVTYSQCMHSYNHPFWKKIGYYYVSSSSSGWLYTFQAE